MIERVKEEAVSLLKSREIPDVVDSVLKAGYKRPVREFFRYLVLEIATLFRWPKRKSTPQLSLSSFVCHLFGIS